MFKEAMDMFLDIILAIVAVKVTMSVISGSLSVGNISGTIKNLAGAAGQKAGTGAKTLYDRTKFAQKRELAKASREATRKRAGQASYANLITQDSWRGRRLRRRAAGRDEDAQQRAWVGGIGTLEKQEQEEIDMAKKVIEHAAVNSPSGLGALAAGASATGINGTTISGAGNKALQMAAVQKLIESEDAEQLQYLFMNQYQTKDAAGNTQLVQGNVDQKALVNQLTKTQNFPKSKATGAHLVKMEAQANNAPYTTEQIQKKAISALSTLNSTKLAGQDAPSVESAVQGYLKGYGDEAERHEFWKQAQAIFATPTTLSQTKPAVQEQLQRIITLPEPSATSRPQPTPSNQPPSPPPPVPPIRPPVPPNP